ncbi:MAG: S41 family peptidase [Bacteroidetes bacterium]|nr:S41 family peptidase [Bacteroidota bacterium]
MTLQLKTFRLFFVFQIIFVLSLSAQTNTSLILNQKILKEIIDTLTYKLEQNYVLPDKGKEMSTFINKKYKDGLYNKVTNPSTLADILTKDVLSVHNDEHFFIEYNPKLAEQLALPRDSVYWAEQLKTDRAKNHGFKNIEVLNGNIGYVDLSYFAYLNPESEKVANASFQVLSNCKAIIIDLRYGMGGQPEIVACIAKHFIKERKHMFELTLRNRENNYNLYCEPDSEYAGLYETPLYILTSYKTFSAAEMLTYFLKTEHRAVIVGEQTRGGAHNAPKSFLYKDFIIALPHGKAYSRTTKTNWESVGISPDIKATADNALEVAEIKIFENYFEVAKDSIEKNNLKWQLELLKAKNNRPQIDSIKLKKRIGTYSYIDISFSGNNLYYERVGRTKFPLVSMTENKMRLLGNDSFIVEFISNSKGDIKEIITYYEDGRKEHSSRDE